MSLSGATGKDTSTFVREISRFNTSDNSPGSRTVDEIPDRSRRNAVIVARNKDRTDRRAVSGGPVVSHDEDIVGLEEAEDPIGNDSVRDKEDDDDEFSTLQHLSKADFRKVIDFSLKNAAKAAAVATQNLAD